MHAVIMSMYAVTMSMHPAIMSMYADIMSMYAVTMSMHPAITSMYAVIMSMYAVITSMYEVIMSMYAVIMSMYAVIMSMYAVIMSMSAVIMRMYAVIMSMGDCHCPCRPTCSQPVPALPTLHHRNFFFHGTIIPPEANHTYLGNAFEHCLLNASRAPGDYLEQRSAEECGAFCGVAAGDCQPLCSGHGMCSFSESVQESTTAVSLAGAAAQPFNGTIILTPPTSNTSGAAQCSAHLPLPFD
ncbi:unnamed protein product [Closterium sp. NIES-65]|nr:unnamed protein product [Closterium sp. NIES-65]